MVVALAPFAQESLDAAAKLASAVSQELLDERAMAIGVLGVGVLWLTDSGIRDREFAAAVFLDRDEGEVGHPSPASETAALNLLLTELGFVPETIATLGIPKPGWQSGPARVSIGDNTGTLGFPVHEDTMAGGSFEGFLTAGHVAQRAELAASIEGVNIGTVHRRFIPLKGDGPGADVALIRTTFEPDRYGVVSVVGSVGVLPGDEVMVHLEGRVVAVRILADANWFLFPEHGVIYGKVYLTDTGVTEAGDSGAPVTSGRHAIGMVVGASGRLTTIVQDIQYQLLALGEDPDIAQVLLA